MNRLRGKDMRSFQSTERVGSVGYRVGSSSRPPLPRYPALYSRISSSRCSLRPQIRRPGRRAPRSVLHPTPIPIEGFQSSLVRIRDVEREIGGRKVEGTRVGARRVGRNAVSPGDVIGWSPVGLGVRGGEVDSIQNQVNPHSRACARGRITCA